MTKKRIAKEWLIFLGSTILSLLITPGLVYFIDEIFSYGNDDMMDIYANFYDALGEMESSAIIALFSLYILIQFTRSIIWAIKAVRSK